MNSLKFYINLRYYIEPIMFFSMCFPCLLWVIFFMKITIVEIIGIIFCLGMIIYSIYIFIDYFNNPMIEFYKDYFQYRLIPEKMNLSIKYERIKFIQYNNKIYDGNFFIYVPDECPSKFSINLRKFHSNERKIIIKILLKIQKKYKIQDFPIELNIDRM